MLKKLGLEVNGGCPLCSQSAYIQTANRFDGVVVACDRCGRFGVAEGALRRVPDRQIHLLSGETRRRTSLQRNVEAFLLTQDKIDEVLSAAGRRAGGTLERLDLALEYARSQQVRANDFVEYRELLSYDYPLVYADNAGEFAYFLETLSTQGLLEEPSGRDKARRTAFRITPSGWQRLKELEQTSIRPNQAFVAMWFEPAETDAAWNQGIRPALEDDLGYKAIRIDETHADNHVDDRILADIRRSGLLVADFTGQRAGVYFEAGFAMGLGIPVVWTCHKTWFERAHFDTRQYQHLVWETPEELRNMLANHIVARIPRRA